MTTETAPGCSIRGCTRLADRVCPYCSRMLCAECWCEDEVREAQRRLDAEYSRRPSRQRSA